MKLKSLLLILAVCFAACKTTDKSKKAGNANQLQYISLSGIEPERAGNQELPISELPQEPAPAAHGRTESSEGASSGSINPQLLEQQARQSATAQANAEENEAAAATNAPQAIAPSETGRPSSSATVKEPLRVNNGNATGSKGPQSDDVKPNRQSWSDTETLSAATQPPAEAGAAGTATQPSAGAGAAGTATQPPAEAGAAGTATQPPAEAGAAGTATQPSVGAGAAGTATQPPAGAGAAGTATQPSAGAGAAGTATQPPAGAGTTAGNTSSSGRQQQGAAAMGQANIERAAPTLPRQNPREAAEPIKVSGPVGELIQAHIPGEGWRLVTEPAPSFKYISRTYTQTGRMSFTFRPESAGVYSLEFQRITANGVERQRVEATIFEIAPEGLPAPLTNEEEGQTVPENQTKRQEAGPQLSETELLAVAGSMNEAELKTAVDQALTQEGKEELAASLGEILSRRFFRNASSAETLYKLGQLFEKQGPKRDLKRAFNYYRRVYNSFPLSPYSRLSQERMDYLNRFFFKIN